MLCHFPFIYLLLFRFCYGPDVNGLPFSFQRERQAQKEESQVLTEKLDQEWKNIQALIVKKTPKADKPEEKPKVGWLQWTRRLSTVSVHLIEV